MHFVQINWNSEILNLGHMICHISLSVEVFSLVHEILQVKFFPDIKSFSSDKNVFKTPTKKQHSKKLKNWRKIWSSENAINRLQTGGPQGNYQIIKWKLRNYEMEDLVPNE